MRRLSEYRDHAEECRMLARRAKSAEDRAMLLNMAATWESLAQAREKQMAKINPSVEEWARRGRTYQEEHCALPLLP